jgi:hypothetical protein
MTDVERRARFAAVVAVVVACHHGTTPTSGPSCTLVADHVLSLLDAKNERAHPIRDAFYKRCTSDAWPTEARACIVDESSLHGGRHCKDRLSGSARQSLDHDLAEIDTPSPPEPCQRYTKVYEASLHCDKLSAGGRERIAAQYRELSSRWTKGDRNLVGEMCTGRAQSVAEQLSAQGCALDSWSQP